MMKKDKPRYKKKAKPHYIKIDKRKILFESSGGRCEICKKKLQNDDPNSISDYMTIDHIFSKSWGGGNHLGNIQALCSACNRAKGNRLIKKGTL